MFFYIQISMHNNILYINEWSYILIVTKFIHEILDSLFVQI